MCRLHCRHRDRTPLWQPQHRHAEADMRGHAGAFPLGECLGKGHTIALDDHVHDSRPEAKQEIAHPAPHDKGRDPMGIRAPPNPFQECIERAWQARPQHALYGPTRQGECLWERW